MAKDEKIIEEYASNVGRPPRNLPNDHPERWQWEYKGSKEDQDRLAELLAGHIWEGEDDDQGELF